jgi:outer membrane lipoprotein SlyB
MVGKLAKSALSLALITASLAAAPAMAHHNDGYQGQYNNGYGYNDGYRGEPVRYGNDYDRPNRNYDYNNGYRCKKSGTGGLIIGAVAGGLLGRAVVGRRGDRTAGTIIGAGAGALAGRALDRNGSNRC